MEKFLDDFEKTMRDGLVKLCRGENLLGDELLTSPDIEGVWNDRYLQPYVADAVENFNDYPEVALAWAAYLGMGVARMWDEDWEKHASDSYESYYGSRGWDDMDEHIAGDVLRLKPEHATKLSSVLDSCALAILGLIRHEGIEAQTATGFHVLVRAYSVMFRIGAGIELHRQGYKKVAVPVNV